MVKFIVGVLFGGFVGVMWMALACIVDDIDEFEEFMLEDRCEFCGGKLSEIREDGDRRYRYCYSCFHEYEVNE